jgi:hypothetical protein
MGIDNLPPGHAAVRDRIIKATVELMRTIELEGADPVKGPDYLYHYTGAVGLQGILQDGHIYVSRAACLNDIQEVTYGETLARRMLRERAGQAAGNPKLSGLIRSLHETAKAPVGGSPGQDLASGWIGGVRADPFVASFSAESDLIGMWAYFAKGGGYCLGFRRSDLVRTTGPDAFNLCPVIYEVESQRRTLNSAIERFEELVVEQLSRESLPHQASGLSVAAHSLWLVVRMLSVRMKAPSFEAEKEWRLMTLALEGEDTPDPSGEKDASHLGFRTVGSRIIPYFKAQYDSGRMPIVSIRSGPTVDGAIAQDSIVRILKNKGYPWRDIRVASSQMLLRE